MGFKKETKLKEKSYHPQAGEQKVITQEQENLSSAQVVRAGKSQMLPAISALSTVAKRAN